MAVVDERWGGPTAERAKAHAARMAATLARQILGVDWKAPGHRAEPIVGSAC